MKQIKRVIKSSINSIFRFMYETKCPPRMKEIDRERIERGLVDLFGSEHIIRVHISEEEFKKFEYDHKNLNTVYDKHWRRYKRKISEYLMVDKILDFASLNNNSYVYMDMMASSSPWAKSLSERYGIRTHAVDIQEPPMVTSVFMRADVTKLPLDGETVNAMSVQSGIELLPDSGDTDFVLEAERVLKPGGKLIISPVYIYKEPATLFGRSYYADGQPEEGARKYMRLDYDLPFTRLYSVESLKHRLLDKTQNGQWSIYHITADKPIELCDKKDPFIYLRYILVFENEQL